MFYHLFHRCRPLLAAVLYLALGACGKTPDQSAPVARVEGAILTVTDLDNQLPDGLGRDPTAPERKQLVDTWVREELLYQEALERKLNQNVRIQKLLEQSHRDVLIAALLNDEFEGHEVLVDEAAIARYFEEHQEEFLRIRPEVHARHILLGNRRDADAARQALDRGEPFAEVSRQHSLDPDTGPLGGDLGYFSEEDDPVLWAVCQNLDLERLSKATRTEYGYHIVQVLDRQEEGSVQKLEQVRPQIVEKLVYQEHARRLDELIARLKTRKQWKIYPAAPAGKQAPSSPE